MAQYQPTNPQPFNFTQAQQNSSSHRSNNWTDEESQWRSQDQSPMQESYVEDYDSDQDYLREFGQQYGGGQQSRQNQSGRNFSQTDRNYGQQNYRGQESRHFGGQSGRNFSQQNSSYDRGRFDQPYQENYGQQNYGQQHYGRQNYEQGRYGQTRNFGNMPFEYDQPHRQGSSNPYQPYEQPYSQQYSQQWPQGQYSAGREENYQDHWQQGAGYYQGQRNPSQRNYSQGTQHGQQYGRSGRSQSSQYPDIGWDNSFMTGSPSQQNQYGGAQQNWSTNQNWRGRAPKGYSRSDERIKEDICERLSHDSQIDASEVSVEVKDGVVTLEGTITDRNQKHRIEDLADSCSGVKDVTNRLTVSRQGQNEQGSSQQYSSRTSGSTGSSSQGLESEHKTSSSTKKQ
jgi:osmotically-inducible protein OsmY